MVAYGTWKVVQKVLSPWASWGNTLQVVKQLTPKHPYVHPCTPGRPAVSKRLIGQAGASALWRLSRAPGAEGSFSISGADLIWNLSAWCSSDAPSLRYLPVLCYNNMGYSQLLSLLGILHMAKLHFCLCFSGALMGMRSLSLLKARGLQGPPHSQW